MAKRKTIHDEIFEIYGLNNLVPKKKENIRHYIRSIIATEFKGKKWNELSRMEKDIIIYVKAKNYLLNFINDKKSKKEIELSINEKVKALLLDTKANILEHNKTISREPYFVEDDTNENKKEAFKRFKQDYFKQFGTETEIRFNDWANNYSKIYKGKNASMSPFDLAYNANEMTDDEVEYLVNPERIDSINNTVNITILMTICKILEEKLNIIVDIEKIRECCTFIYDYLQDGVHDPLLPRHLGNEDDETYEMSSNMEKNLAFWDEKKSDSDSNKKSDSKH